MKKIVTGWFDDILSNNSYLNIMSVTQDTHFQVCSNINLIRQLVMKLTPIPKFKDVASHVKNVETEFFKQFESMLMENESNYKLRDLLEIQKRSKERPDRFSNIERLTFCNEFETTDRFDYAIEIGIKQVGVDMIAFELIKRMEYYCEYAWDNHCDNANCKNESCVNNAYVKKFYSLCRNFTAYLKKRMQSFTEISAKKGWKCLEAKPKESVSVAVPVAKPVAASFAEIAKQKTEKIVVKDDVPIVKISDSVKVNLMRDFGDVSTAIMKREIFESLTLGDADKPTDLVRVEIHGDNAQEVVMPIEVFKRIEAPRANQDATDLVQVTRIVKRDNKYVMATVIMYRYAFDEIECVE